MEFPNYLTEEHDEELMYSREDEYRQLSWAGDATPVVLLKNIEEQFKNLTQPSDFDDHVGMFYLILEDSRELVPAYGSVVDHSVMYEELDLIEEIFVEKITNMFYNYLGIGILDSDDVTPAALQSVITDLYEYFVLYCKENMLSVCKELLIERYDNDLEEILRNFQSISDSLDPLMFHVVPSDFIMKSNHANKRVIHDNFTNGVFNGNFLKKITPRFYANPSFMADVHSSISLMRK